MPENQDNITGRTFGERSVPKPERSCLNCMHEVKCWSTPVSYPPCFHIRSSWDVRNWEPFIKSVFGGTCGVFIHNDPILNASLQKAEENKLRIKNGNEWEV